MIVPDAALPKGARVLLSKSRHSSTERATRPAGLGHLQVDDVWRSWLTPPPRGRESVREQRLLDAATRLAIPFRGQTLSAYAWGSGPTVLLMHGWGGRAGQLGSFVAPLVEADVRAVAVDAPGHGRTAGNRSNLFEFAEVVESVASSQEPVHAIIAHSMGAASATIALGRSITVNRVVLLCPIRRLRDALSRFSARANLSESIELELVARMEEKFGPSVWDDSDLDKIAPRLVTPALIIHDPQDAEIPYADSVRTAQAWRTSRLLATSRLGHQSLLRDSSVISHVVRFVTSTIQEPGELLPELSQARLPSPS